MLLLCILVVRVLINKHYDHYIKKKTQKIKKIKKIIIKKINLHTLITRNIINVVSKLVRKCVTGAALQNTQLQAKHRDYNENTIYNKNKRARLLHD